MSKRKVFSLFGYRVELYINSRRGWKPPYFISNFCFGTSDEDNNKLHFAMTEIQIHPELLITAGVDITQKD